MKLSHLATYSALGLLSSASFVQAAPAAKPQIYDFTLGPRLFQLKDSDTKRSEEISMDGAKALALKNPKDKKEIQQKRMVIVGKEGEYLFGFHVYWEKTPTPFPLAKDLVRYTATYPGGNLGGDLMMPGKDADGILSSPWITTTGDVKRTSVRREINLKKGTNLITFNIDAYNDFSEYEQSPLGAIVKKLEDNNSVTFAVELVTEIKRPDIKLPR